MYFRYKIFFKMALVLATVQLYTHLVHTTNWFYLICLIAQLQYFYWILFISDQKYFFESTEVLATVQLYTHLVHTTYILQTGFIWSGYFPYWLTDHMQTVRCCTELYMVVQNCTLLYRSVHCCTELYTIVKSCTLL